jgi:hypothetical protein
VALVEFVLLAGCGLEAKIVLQVPSLRAAIWFQGDLYGFLRIQRANLLQVTFMRAALRLKGELYSV